MTKTFKTHKHRILTCPTCHERLNARSETSGTAVRAPLPGDLSVCAGCGEAFVLTDDLGLKILDPEDMIDLSADLLLQLYRVQYDIREQAEAMHQRMIDRVKNEG